MNNAQDRIQPHWWLKSSVGALLGLSLSIGMAGVIYLCGTAFLDQDVLAQLAMWSIPWIWLPIFFASFYFKTGLQAFTALMMVNVFVYACLWWLKG